VHDKDGAETKQKKNERVREGEGEGERDRDREQFKTDAGESLHLGFIFLRFYFPDRSHRSTFQ
jgi:hypothetical protein